LFQSDHKVMGREQQARRGLI